MKHRIKYFLPVLIALYFVACQSGSQGNKTDTAEETPSVDVVPLAENDYKYFTGTIANMPVVVIIESINGIVSGHYYYEKYRQTIPLTNQPSRQKKGTWHFVEAALGADSSKSYPVWECTLKNGVLSGTWQNAKRTKSYPIKLKENYPEGVTRFSYQHFDRDCKAFPDWDSSPVAQLNTYFPVALGSQSRIVWLNQQIKLALSFDTSLSFEKGREKWEEKYRADYIENLSGMDSSYLSAAASNWQSNREVFVKYNGNGLVTLGGQYYEYAGGAHGNPAAINICLDVSNKKVLQLSDILRIDSAVLQQLLESRFRRDYNLAPDDSLTQILFDDELLPNKNFGISSSGIYFTYNPYEVAPYVVGIIDIFIPYESLKNYLKEDFKKRMNLPDK